MAVDSRYAIRLGCLIALLLSVPVDFVWGQDTQRMPTTYPYGCIEDETLRRHWIDGIPLRCTAAYFNEAKFGSLADFAGAKFDSLAAFNDATFCDRAKLHHATFSSRADFHGARFKNRAHIGYSGFESGADFGNARFDSLAKFSGTRFNGEADFGDARFESRAVFTLAEFDSLANFQGASFHGRADFYSVKFQGRPVFWEASFWDEIDFRSAQFDTSASFARAVVRDTMLIGTWRHDVVQYFDLRLARFPQRGYEIPLYDSSAVAIPGAAVILNGPANLRLQVEKFDVLHLAEGLSYVDKKNIIAYLKNNSFNDDDQKRARFELDYLLARSTMHQRLTGRYREYPWYHYRLWWNYLYYYLMGFGYRPFRIFLWAGAMVLFFGVYYRWQMPHQTHVFVQNDPQDESAYSGNPNQSRLLTPWIHALYFSTMVFFTLRLKRKILKVFDAREQRIIVTQWVMGFLIYVAFLTLAKSGSILQQLKVLFVG